MFKSPKEADQFLSDQESAYATVRQTLGTRTFVNRCMVEGIQWIGGGVELANIGRTDRRATNWSPDSNKLVATINRTTKLIHETHAATFPDRIEAEVPTGVRDTGIEASNKSHVMESVVNSMIDFSGYVQAARDCNYRRCVDGTHGMGYGIKIKRRAMPLRNGGEEMVDDQILRAFTFDAMKLTLDPLNQNLDLQNHEFVIYSEVWPIQKINRSLGLKLNENELETCGALMGMEMYANAFSMNRLYANMALFSRTKGARVHQMHIKDETGRFSSMLVGVKIPQGRGVQWVNFDDQETPFGGMGMPFTLLHGHRRPDSMWSVSDVAMLKDDQDRLNLLNTFFYRMLQKNAGAQWMVAEEAMKSQDPDEFRTQFNNAVFGLVMHKTGTRDRPIPPPQLVKYPDPPAFVQDTIMQNQADMREQVHRPDITQGATKTHVPNSTYQSALQGANQVLGGRIREDLTRHEFLLGVGLGTVVKLAQEGSPSILGELHRSGLNAQDFSILAQSDPYYPVCEIRIRESSIKYESKEQKEDRVWKAVQLQVETDPMKIRMALADMDIALDKNDKTMHANANRSAQSVLMGQEWQPMNLGEYNQMFITQFQLAMFDQRAIDDPQAQARLNRAIDSQTQVGNMLLQAKTQAENPQPPQPDQPQEQPQPQEPTEADLNSLLQAIQSGSGSSASSPQIAA